MAACANVKERRRVRYQSTAPIEVQEFRKPGNRVRTEDARELAEQWEKHWASHPYRAISRVLQ